MNLRSALEFFISVFFLGFVLCASLSCQDKYLTVERRIVDADTKIPIYFNTYAEQDGLNTWRPVFTYYVYTVDEGEYDAYFHAYMIDSSSNVVWSGVQPLKIEGGKKVWGQYVTDAEFYPDIIPNVTPMAYVSVEY